MAEMKFDLGPNGGVVKSTGVEEAMTLLGAVRNEPMSKHTSLKVGGPADWFFTAQSPDDVSVARIVARNRSLPFHVIGAGTNLLVSDDGLRGMVVKLGGSIGTITEHDTGLLKAGAGVKLPDLARAFRDRNASGLEWALGVPGTVGGAVFMNAGTGDGEMKHVVERVIVEGRGGALIESLPDSCGFSYRKSRFQHTGEVVLAAIVKLGPAPFREEIAKRSLEHRKKTQPLQLPNCGSVFANPPNDYAARLIEECGLKGRTHGGAQISTMHANFIVNNGGARAADIKALMDIAALEVKKRFGIELRSEVRLVGSFN